MQLSISEHNNTAVAGGILLSRSARRPAHQDVIIWTPIRASRLFIVLQIVRRSSRAGGTAAFRVRDPDWHLEVRRRATSKLAQAESMDVHADSLDNVSTTMASSSSAVLRPRRRWIDGSDHDQ